MLGWRNPYAQRLPAEATPVAVVAATAVVCTPQMGRILEAIRDFLAEEFGAEGLEPDEDTIAFRFADDDTDREWGCLAVAIEEADQVMFYSVRLQPVPEERRPAAMEFITRANYGMHVGNFEIDLDDGEVRFKTAMDVEDTDVSPTLCRNLVEVNLAVMGRYLQGLDAVADEGGSPEEVLAAIEDDEDDEENDEEDEQS